VLPQRRQTAGKTQEKRFSYTSSFG